MEIVSIIITLIALIATVVFGYLQIVVPFIKKEVRLSKKFPYVESTDIPKKRRRRKKKRLGRRWLIPITAVIVILIAIILFRVLLLQATELPPKPIAVMTFKNFTGDENYDYLCEAIPNLLITNLEQSEHLQVMTWERMHDLLKVLGKEELELIDEETGFELCCMDDVNTIVTGSFTKAGDMFVTDVKVLDVSSKELLKTANSQGEGVASILKTQVDDLSKAIAKNVSLFERTVAPTEMQIMEVTTNSMDAYRYFLRGRTEYEKFYLDEAKRFLEKAVELDSTFASAYLYLAFAYGGLNDEKARKEALEKAQAFSSKTTEKERLWIESWYARDIEGDIETRFRILKLMPKKYPKDKMSHLYLGKYYQYVEQSYGEAIKEYNIALELDPCYGWAIMDLAYLYIIIEKYDLAMEHFQRYATISPGDANPFDCMGDLYFRMELLDSALSNYKEAIEIKPNFWDTSRKIAYLYALKQDYDEAMKCIAHHIIVAPSSGVKASGYRSKAHFNCYLGNFGQALADLDTCEELLMPFKSENQKMANIWTKGWVYYNMRKFELSRSLFNNYYLDWYDSVLTIIDHHYPLALIDLKQENYDLARAKYNIIKSLLPDVRKVYTEEAQLLHDFLYMEILLAVDSLGKAITIGEKVLQVGIDDPNSWFRISSFMFCYNKNGLARAYLNKDDIEKAILEYEKLTDPDPNNRGRCLVRPLWYYELAKLYEEKGSNTKAIEQYEKFLDIWKDADDDLPEPHDARQRLAMLKQK